MTVHHKKLKVLVTEIFKVKNDLPPDIMKNVFELKEPAYNIGQNKTSLHAEMLRLLTRVSYQVSTTNMVICFTKR